MGSKGVSMNDQMQAGAVYVQTHDASDNQIVAYPPPAAAAQISFSPDGRTLVVTERGTNSISSFSVDERGYADGPETIASAGATPYGFDFTAAGTVVVTEAFGGEIGRAAASSYSITGPGRL